MGKVATCPLPSQDSRKRQLDNVAMEPLPSWGPTCGQNGNITLDVYGVPREVMKDYVGYRMQVIFCAQLKAKSARHPYLFDAHM